MPLGLSAFRIITYVLLCLAGLRFPAQVQFRLLIKESLLIKRDKPMLNKTIKLFSLKLFD